MKRILHVIESLKPCGAISQLRLLLRRLPRDEFESQVCVLGRTADDHRRQPPDGVKVTYIDQVRAFDLSSLRRLSEVIADAAPDVVHSWQSNVHAMGRLAALWTGTRRTVVTERDCPGHLSRFQGWLDRLLVPPPSVIVVNDPALRTAFERCGTPPERLTLIPDGIEPPSVGDTTRETLLAELGLPSNTRLIGTVGRFAPAERLKDVVWTADLLKVIRDDVHLLVIGDGPQRPRLERYRRQVQIEDRVHFLGLRDDLPQLLTHLDVFWQAREEVGLPHSLLQAMTSSVPVVVADNQSTRSLLMPGKNGYLFGPGDRAVLAKLTERLLNDAELARSLGAAGREMVLERFPGETMVARHAELYRIEG